jgi:hypothetical protein
MRMKEAIVFIGLVVLIVGIIIAFSNPIQIYHPATPGWEEHIAPGQSRWHPGTDAWTETIYPYAIVGALVCLMGVITAIIGWAMPARTPSPTT